MQNSIKFALTTKYRVRQINKSWGRNLLTYFNVLSFNCLFLENTRDRHGRDSMLDRFITTMYLCNQCISPLTLSVWILLRLGDSLSGISIRSVVLFSFLPHKIERYDINEILMKVALKTTTPFRKHALMWQSMHLGVLHTWWICMYALQNVQCWK